MIYTVIDMCKKLSASLYFNDLLQNCCHVHFLGIRWFFKLHFWKTHLLQNCEYILLVGPDRSNSIPVNKLGRKLQRHCAGLTSAQKFLWFFVPKVWLYFLHFCKFKVWKSWSGIRNSDYQKVIGIFLSVLNFRAKNLIFLLFMI